MDITKEVDVNEADMEGTEHKNIVKTEEDTKAESKDINLQNVRAYLRNLRWDDIDPDQLTSYLWTKGLVEMWEINTGIIAAYEKSLEEVETPGATMEAMEEVDMEGTEHKDINENVKTEEDTKAKRINLENIRAYLKSLSLHQIDPDVFMRYLWSEGLEEMGEINPRIVAAYEEWWEILDRAADEAKPVAASDVDQPKTEEKGVSPDPHKRVGISEKMETQKELLHRIKGYSDDFAKRGGTFTHTANMVNAEVFIIKCQWEDAAETLQQLKPALGGMDKSELFRYYHMVAKTATQLGKFDYSLQTLNELKGLQGGGRDDDLERIRTTVEYGTLQTKCGNHEEARSCLEISYKYLDEENVPELVHCLTTLAQAETGLGMFREAENHQTIVVDKLKGTLGQKKNLPTANHNLAEIYRKSGQFEKARVLHEVAVEYFAKEMGEDNVDTLTAKVHLADTYLELGRLNDAALRYEEVVHHRERLFRDTPNHSAIFSVKQKLLAAWIAIARKHVKIGDVWDI